MDREKVKNGASNRKKSKGEKMPYVKGHRRRKPSGGSTYVKPHTRKRRKGVYRSKIRF